MSEIINVLVPIASITPHPRNFREHPEAQLMQLRASHERFSQYRSVVLWARPDGGYVQVAGHGVTQAMQERGITHVRADILPVETPQEEVDAILVADNLLPVGASDDDAALAALLQEQMDAGFDLAAMGGDEESLRQMLQGLGDGYLAGEGKSEGTFNDDEDEDLAADDSIFSQEAIAAEAFKYFRNTGFPYRTLPVYMCMQQINKLASLEGDKLINSSLAYHVADTYHPHRFHSSAEHMWSPYEAFHDDKRLQKTFDLYLGELGSGSIPLDILGNLCIVSTTQACANFRPGFAMYLYRKYCKPGATVLDTSTGYGGRLIGFIASRVAGKYIGIDPNTGTHQANLRMAADLQFADKIELHNLPAEDVDTDLLINRCDFAFTSPPYFAKEHYSDEDTQSWKRYGTSEAWRVGFLQKMIALQYAALKSGSYSIVNIADVQLRGKWYPLSKWVIEDGKASGFEYVETLEFPLHRRFGEGHTDEVATEPVIVFRKPAKESVHA